LLINVNDVKNKVALAPERGKAKAKSKTALLAPGLIYPPPAKNHWQPGTGISPSLSWLAGWRLAGAWAGAASAPFAGRYPLRDRGATRPGGL